MIIYEKKLHITEVGMKCHFFHEFGKTVILIIYCLTGVNSYGQFEPEK